MKPMFRLAGIFVFLTSLIFQSSTGRAQGTAFTYQGRLSVDGCGVNGYYDFIFTLYATNTGGVAITEPVTNADIVVSNGLVTALVNFGPGVFTGSNYWLDVQVSSNAANAFSELTPRQEVTPTPYAIYAPSAGAAIVAGSANSVLAQNVSGVMALTQLPTTVVTNGANGITLNGTFSGNGAGVTNVNLMTVNSQGTITSGTNWGSFTAAYMQTFSSDISLDSIALVDVNSDGYLDLIGATGTNTIGVFTNNGRGILSSNASYTVGQGPVSVVAADVNGDGHPDLISVCDGFIAASNAYFGSTIVVLTNNGSGIFVSNATYQVTGSPAGVVLAADVNGDGHPDLVYLSGNAGTFSVWTNNGSGIFVSNATYAVPNVIATIVATDVNKDGYVDLITANYGANSLTVFTNNGFGLFGSNATYNVGSMCQSLVAADINGDGYPDLISGSVLTNTMMVLTNNGTGGFSSSVPLSVPYFTGIDAMAMADVNGDGYPDLIAACGNNTNGQNTVVFTNNGTGIFGLSGMYSDFIGGYATFPENLAAGNLGSDGHVDLVTFNNNGLFSVLTNTPITNGIPVFNGAFYGNGSGLKSLEATNLVGAVPASSLTILPATNLVGSVPVSSLTSVPAASLTGMGTLPASVLPVLPVSDLPAIAVTNMETNVTLGGTLSGTFNGNGGGLTNLSGSQLTGLISLAQFPTNVVTNMASGLTLEGGFSGNGSGLTNLQLSGIVLSASQLPSGVLTNGASGVTLNGAFAGAFTGNGSDLTNLNASQVNGTFTGAFIGNGGGLTNLSASQINGTVSVSQLPGSVVTNGASGVTLTGTLNGNGAGVTNISLSANSQGAIAVGTNWTYGQTTATTLTLGTQPIWVAAADIRGVGYPDLLGLNRASASLLVVYTNNGSGIFSSNASYAAGNLPNTMTLADTRKSGHLDVLIGLQSLGGIMVLTNNGTGVFGSNAFYACSGQDAVSIAPFTNVNGYLDLACEVAEAPMEIFTNNGAGIFYSNSVYSTGVGFSVVAADINGDGHEDLITANSGSATLTVMTNNGSDKFVVSATLNTLPGSGGNEATSLVVTDVNGDGHPDLVCGYSFTNLVTVFTNNGTGGFGTNGNYALNNGAAMVGSQFNGIAAADVNGDGHVDLICANYNTNTVTVLTNNGSGGFVFNATYTVGSGPIVVTAAYVNGTNNPDIVTANVNTNTITVLGDSYTTTGLNFAGSFGGTFSGSGANLTNINANAITGGLTTNLTVSMPSGTVTLYFTNGILRAAH